MSFQSAAKNNASNNNSNPNAAQGFLNFYLPNSEGGRNKVGSIPLKESNVRHKQLMDWLRADPARILKLMAKMEIEFNSAQAEDMAGFALDDDAPVGGAKAPKTAKA